MLPSHTSRLAYKQIQEEGTARTQRNVILEAVKSHHDPKGEGLSRRELSLLTEIENSSVCGRVNGLLKDGLLEETTKRFCTISKRLIAPVIPVLTVEEVKQEDIEMEGKELLEEVYSN